ncbi:MAG: response regulator [Chloroflexi bacterium]|uniref:histidine kinase n=1 Tax=Candidatus Chlorohelix allophototropha TaxID=3003348 RepID=A0A8T7M5K6_9CHLR|nr:response regulator [Chloroflexota bacterium]WJW69303.1 ATP-binding protein [Chloroflexota bacterium L227-S17]
MLKELPDKSGQNDLLDRLSDLAQQSANIFDEQELAELYQLVIEDTVRFIDIETVLLSFIQVNPFTAEEIMVVKAASTSAKNVIGDTFKRGERLSGRAWQQEGMIAMTGADYDKQVGDALKPDRTLSAVAAIPIFCNKQVVGILNVLTFKPGRVFNDSDLFLLQSFAYYIGIAYKNALAFRREKQRVAELTEIQISRSYEQKLVQIVLEQMADALLVVDQEEKIIQTNPATGTLFRVPWKSMVETNLAELRCYLKYKDGTPITPDNCLVRRALSKGETIASEDILYQAELEQLTLNINVAPIRQPDGLISGAVITLRDVTTQRHNQEFDSHQERLRALGQLAGGVAHDLNNLLSGIMGAADIIRTETKNILIEHPRIGEALKLIQQVGSDGAEMVRRIQTYSRTTQKGDDEVVSLDTSVYEALKLTESRWKAEAAMRGIAISIESTVPTDLKVKGNSTELRELFTNLILNAVDALGKKEGQISIVGSRVNPDTIKIEFSDDGCGIPSHLQNRIFEPFFTTKGNSGTGLGLAIVRNIVERMEGSIQIQSIADHGTTFSILLPSAKIAFVEPLEPLESVVAPVENLNRSFRIVAIDDEPILGHILGRMLESMGHAARTFSDPRQAIQVFKDNPDDFDVVITDLGMPKITGWEVAQAIKAVRPKTPVIVVTGWYLDDTPEKLQEKGADAVIIKPYTSQHLQDTLRKIQKRFS